MGTTVVRNSEQVIDHASILLLLAYIGLGIQYGYCPRRWLGGVICCAAIIAFIWSCRFVSLSLCPTRGYIFFLSPAFLIPCCFIGFYLFAFDYFLIFSFLFCLFVF